MNWRTRVAVDSIKAVLPFEQELRHLKRRLFPYATNNENDKALLSESIRQINALRARGVNLKGKRIIEIGSGWCPILPLVYWMAGASEVTMVDQKRLMDGHTLNYAAHYIVEHLPKFAKFPGTFEADYRAIPNDLIPVASSFDQSSARFGFHYLAPFDFRDLPDHSADLIVSRDVLEHIPEKLLCDIAVHSGRILRPGGLLCHSIDMTDHWWHHDKSISSVNFLRYEEDNWRWACINRHSFQNRLRRFEYVKIFTDAGFAIKEATGVPNPEALKALESLPICHRYATTPHNELAILGTLMIVERG